MFFFRALLVFLSLNFSITFAELKEVDKSLNLNSTNNAEANKDLDDDQTQMEPGLTTNEDYSAVVDTLVEEANVESLPILIDVIEDFNDKVVLTTESETKVTKIESNDTTIRVQSSINTGH